MDDSIVSPYGVAERIQITDICTDERNVVSRRHKVEDGDVAMAQHLGDDEPTKTAAASGYQDARQSHPPGPLVRPTARSDRISNATVAPRRAVT